MRYAFRPWEKRESRESREHARRCGAEFQVKSTTIARCPTRTKLARELFGRGNIVLDRGASAARAAEFSCEATVQDCLLEASCLMSDDDQLRARHSSTIASAAPRSG